VVVPWINVDQLGRWLTAWNITVVPSWLLTVQDEHCDGCARTKNRGVDIAVDAGAEVVVILDDDCFPTQWTLEQHARLHMECLAPQAVESMFVAVTDPPSRGTPYFDRSVTMPVAASMGFWKGIGDYDAARQLAHREAPMVYDYQTIHGRYFPLCGMNVAFRPAEWDPWWRFVDVPRFDDIWSGWMWQREAYDRGCCFNLNGPEIRHVRQSNPWRNLQVEARHLEVNETLWKQIAVHPDPTYENLSRLLPSDPGGSDR